MERPLRTPACPSAPYLHPSGPSPSVGSPSPAALPPPVIQSVVEHPLYLSIDGSSVSRLRAVVLDEHLRVVWSEQVSIDEDLPQYGTRCGVHACEDIVTCPAEARVHALDLVLEKLKRDCPDPTLFSRMVAVSGAGQPHTLYHLSTDFPMLLDLLSSTPQRRLSSVLSAANAFTIAHPATTGDMSAAPQVGELELRFGDPYCSNPVENTKLAEEQAHQLERGRQEIARRTGSKLTAGSAAAQLLRVMQGKSMREQGGTGTAKSSSAGRTGKIVLESGLLASVFLGRYAPADAADACSTGLFDPVGGKWDVDVLSYVGSGGDQHQDENAGSKLEALLGEVQLDGGNSLGKVSPYFVRRFGFSADCIIVPFSGSDPSMFLAFPLSHSSGERDALVSLSSVAETDTLAVPLGRYLPDAERLIACHPAKAWREDTPRVNAKEQGREVTREARDEVDGATPDFVAFISSRDAGVGRTFARDMYCNSQWDVFAHLSAIVPHGGTIGLDDKCYSFFFPSGEATSAQGLIRFVQGARVTEFADRKVNPRLLIESQAMSLRQRLGHLYRALLPEDDSSLASVRPFDPVGFPLHSPSFSPTRIILVGDAALNPSIPALFSTIFHAPAFVPVAHRHEAHSSEHSKACAEETRTAAHLERPTTTAPGLGAGYKAAWGYARAVKGDRTTFSAFLQRALESHEGPKPPPEFSEAPRYTIGENRAVPAVGTLDSGPSSLSRSGASSSTHTPSCVSLPSSGHAADPPGLALVALPDPDEARYYDSMLPEFGRLERCALKGLI